MTRVQVCLCLASCRDSQPEGYGSNSSKPKEQFDTGQETVGTGNQRTEYGKPAILNSCPRFNSSPVKQSCYVFDFVFQETAFIWILACKMDPFRTTI